jgi:hypothetical protein
MKHLRLLATVRSRTNRDEDRAAAGAFSGRERFHRGIQPFPEFFDGVRRADHKIPLHDKVEPRGQFVVAANDGLRQLLVCLTSAQGKLGPSRPMRFGFRCRLGVTADAY